MRCISALICGAAFLAAGCNSKTSPPPAAEEESAAADLRENTKSDFRSRAAAVPGAGNEVRTVKTPASTAKKRPPFPPRPTVNDPAASPDEAITVAEVPAELATETARPEDIPLEGDEILVPPKMLGKLLPGTNFESVQREEPINVKSFLDQQGIVLTNYQQLVEMGITNYQIVRAQRAEKSDK